MAGRKSKRNRRALQESRPRRHQLSSNRDAQFHVEYVKDPRDIHEVVLQVTNYEEAGRHPSPKRCARETKSRADTDTGSDDQQATQKSKAKPKVRNTTLHKGDNFHRSKDTIQALQRQMGEIQKCLDALVKNKDYNNQPAVPSVISSSTPSTGVTYNQTTVSNGMAETNRPKLKGKSSLQGAGGSSIHVHGKGMFCFNLATISALRRGRDEARKSFHDGPGEGEPYNPRPQRSSAPLRRSPRKLQSVVRVVTRPILPKPQQRPWHRSLFDDLFQPDRPFRKSNKRH
uniref:Uncharacterized protein n=1 Tax=Magallana gigas TaxID=29159 RepID=K1RH43_MAGGI